MKRFGWFAVAGGLTLPWILMRFLGVHADPLMVSLLAGMAIMGAAFLLSWAAEAAEGDFSGSLIIALLALIVMLPEYAIDGTLSWSAGKDATFAPYAIANMTGANRLLIGVGWAAVVFMFWLKTKGKKTGIDIKPVQRVDCGILACATIYVLAIPLKGFIAWYDAVVLFCLFGAYLFRITRVPSDAHHEVVGPAAAITEISRKSVRRVTWVGLIAYAAVAIFLSAEPFAHGLIETGKTIGIDEFILVQWLAPLASEMPEFIVAVLFVWRIQAYRGLGILVSSGINQLTLLVGSIPILFMVSRMAAGGDVGNFPLDGRQAHELYLTAAQSLFAVVLLANLHLSWKEAGALFGLFLPTLFIGSSETRMWFVYMYLSLAVLVLLFNFRSSFHSWKAIGKSLAGNEGATKSE
jgi:cation:H+ antiporter